MLLSLLPLAACSHSEPPAPVQADLSDVAIVIGRTLHRRTEAMLEHDEHAFLATVVRKGGIVGRQRTYFANLSAMPVSTLRFKLVPDSVAPGSREGTYWAEVQTTLELSGYDDKPVRSYDRWLFTPTRNQRRYLVASTIDPAWEADHATAAEPWDVGRVHVRESVGVLGVFDDSTWSHAGEVIDAVADARYSVESVLPTSADDSDAWGTVVYVLGDSAVIDGLTGRAVGDPGRADGLTVAVPADVDDASRGTASYRISLSPRVLDQDHITLDRLIRHELTHALLRGRGSGAPLWLTEGIAEYVSVQALPMSERRLQAAAIGVGEAAQELPTVDDFAGPDSEAWYGVSWWICQYIANTYGRGMLWTLLDRLGGGADVDSTLGDVLGLTSQQLLRRGVALMVATY